MTTQRIRSFVHQHVEVMARVARRKHQRPLDERKRLVVLGQGPMFESMLIRELDKAPWVLTLDG